MPETKAATLIVKSEAFEHEGTIPEKYTCDGQGINPPLQLEDLPKGTESLVIIAADPDAPRGTFDHWLAWNIPPITIIDENYTGGVSGMNGAGKTGYYGPCPPSGSHRYYFYVYALDTTLHLQAGSNKKALLEEIQKHLLAKGILMGRYERKEKETN